MRLPPFFDPDTDVFSQATAEHFLFSAALCWLLGLFLAPWSAFGWTLWTGAIYELGQWDACRGQTACHRDGDLAQRFLCGYGFGLTDLAADAAGALLAVLVRLA